MKAYRIECVCPDGLRWLAAWLLLCVLWTGHSAQAQSLVCDSVSMTPIASPLGFLPNNGATVLGATTGTLNMNNCRAVGASSGQRFIIQLNPASFRTLTAAPGISFVIKDIASTGISNGCNSQFSESGINFWQRALTVNSSAQASGCNLSYSYTVTMQVTDATQNLSATIQNNLTTANVNGIYSPILVYLESTTTISFGVDFPTPIVLQPKTCTLSTSSMSVTLPPVARSQLSASGAVAGTTDFSVDLKGCSFPGGNYNVSATWSFTQGAAANVIQNSAGSPASNVQVQLLTAAGTPISSGQTVPVATVTAAGSYSGNFKAQYYAPAAATPGKVTGVATLNLSYN